MRGRRGGILMKKNCLKKLMSVIMLLSVVVVLQYDVNAGATISKPKKVIQMQQFIIKDHLHIITMITSHGIV